MFAGLSLTWLLLAFGIAAAITWAAGIWLSDTTDILASRFGLGQALGGLILLAISTNLPEIAITATAAARHNLGIATGNLLGGIAIQTLVLAFLDFALTGAKPLTYRAASLTMVLEATLVIAVLSFSILGTQLAPSLVFWRFTPENLLIALTWIAGLFMLKRAKSGLSWQASGQAPDGQQKQAGHSQSEKDAKSQGKRESTGKVVAKFAVASVATLIAGYTLEQSGDHIASHIGMSGVLFGATVLAASTSLPELSTGITSVRMNDYQLAMSDIFGGNAFLPALFLLASLLSGSAVLPHAHKSDVYLATLGILLTAVYIFGLILRPARRYARMGLDSWLVLILYAVGICGLLFVTS